jgi:uncharacterized lipoprotein YbaY
LLDATPLPLTELIKVRLVTVSRAVEPAVILGAQIIEADGRQFCWKGP